MKKERTPDPVDLMLAGKFDVAGEAYVSLYKDALARGDFAFSPDLLMGLLYCVAGMSNHEPTAAEAGQAVKGLLTKQHVRLNRRVLEDLQVATSMIEKGREKAQKIIAGVEFEAGRRTGK